MKRRSRSAHAPDGQALVPAAFLDRDPSWLIAFDPEGRPLGRLHLEAALVSYEVAEASPQERACLASRRHPVGGGSEG